MRRRVSTETASIAMIWAALLMLQALPASAQPAVTMAAEPPVVSSANAPSGDEQQPPAPDNQEPAALVSQKPPAPDAQKGPAAEGEEGAKPTRGFFSALVHNLGDDVKHIPRRNSLYWLAGGVALAAAIHPEDGEINRKLLGNSTADTFFRPGKYIGNTGIVVGASALTYLVGQMRDEPRLRHLGMDELEATLLSEGLAESAKLIIRRDRPIDPLGRQAKGYSMPSGHATVTFAAATVLQQHLGYRAGIPTYLIASYVAASRLHDNRHYASDVAMGAALGVIVGRSVTYHGRNFWGGPVVVPGGVEFVLARK